MAKGLCVSFICDSLRPETALRMVAAGAHYDSAELEEGARGFILDLRSNPGGLLREARKVADLFLPRGKPVVTTDSRVEEPKLLSTRRPASVPDHVPVVCEGATGR